MKHREFNGTRAHIHPDLFPFGHIEHGSIEQVAEAEAWLLSHGCTHARGPIGPNTWGPYRAVIESDGRPHFLGEPTDSPVVWEARGYTACAQYASAIASNADQVRRTAALGQCLGDQGWRLQDLACFTNFDEALGCFYEMSGASFSQAFAYTSIDADSFHAMYKPLESIADPDMILTAFLQMEFLLDSASAFPTTFIPIEESSS